MNRADVINNMTIFLCPNVQLVGYVRGSSITLLIFLLKSISTTHAPPATLQFQIKPSVSKYEPSGTPLVKSFRILCLVKNCLGGRVIIIRVNYFF